MKLNNIFYFIAVKLCMKDAEFLGTFEWNVLVVDEGHRLKNRESLLHRTLLQVGVAWKVNSPVTSITSLAVVGQMFNKVKILIESNFMFRIAES